MLLKQFAGARQLGARFRSSEKWPPKQLFQAFDARRDSRLCDVELARSINEAPGLGNDEKGTSEIDVHQVNTSTLTIKTHLSIFSISPNIKFRLCIGLNFINVQNDSTRVGSMDAYRLSMIQTEGRSKMAKAAKKAAKKAPAKKAAKKKKK